jgi:hypothetical protein
MQLKTKKLKMEENQSVGVGPFQVNQNDISSEATELFASKEDDLSMLDGRFIAYEPLLPNLDSDNYDFQIPLTGMTYLQLPNSRLYVKGKITQDDGTDMIAEDVGKVAFANMPLTAMFQRIDVTINGVPMTDLSNCHANYKGYLETMMSYSDEAVNGHLSSSAIVMDTPGFFGNFTGAAETNQGFIERAVQVGKSKTFELMGPITGSDFFQIAKYFPPGVKLGIKFVKASNEFLICSAVAKRFKFKVEKVVLYIRHVVMSDALIHKHQTLLAGKKKLTMPYTKSEITTFNQSHGGHTFNMPSVIIDTLPRPVIFGFIKTANFYGAYAKNGWHFENLSIDNLFIKVNGVHIPATPYTPDFANNLFCREFREFHDNIGISHSRFSNMISPKFFKDGLCLWAFDLSPDMCNGWHLHPRKSGTLGIEVHFKNALTEPTTVVVFSQYDATLTLEAFQVGSNKITTNYAAVKK